MKYSYLCFSAFVISCGTLSAQTKSDTLAIKEAAANYVEGYYMADAQRVAKAVHPELSKRIISKGGSLRDMGASNLVEAAKMNKKPEASGEPFKITVAIFDITKNIASVKITTNKMPFFDYAHLGKIDGEWKVINVLWAMNE